MAKRKTAAQKAAEANAKPDASADEKRAATEAQFAEADAKGEPDLEAARVQLQVRGF